MVLYDTKKVDESIAVYREGLRVCGASDMLTEGLLRVIQSVPLASRFVPARSSTGKTVQGIYEQIGLRQSRGMVNEALELAKRAFEVRGGCYVEGAVNVQAAEAHWQLGECLFRAGHENRAIFSSR